MSRAQWLATFAVAMVGLVATNSYTTLERDSEFLIQNAGDALNYLEIARAAPGLPETSLPYHHAQRLAVPYAIGLVHEATGVDLYLLFRVAAAAFSLVALGFFIASLRHLRVPSFASLALALAFLLNPYAFRYFLTLPGVINDIAFAAALSALLYYQLRRRHAAALLCLALAALCRQTAIFLVPALLIGRAAILPTIAIPALIYLGTSALARGFSAPSVNLSTVTGLFTWLVDSFSIRALGEFLLRAILPLSIPLATILGAIWGSRKFPTPPFGWLVLVAISVCAQPILGGPVVTAQSVARLDALALAPLLLAAGVALREAGTWFPEPRPWERAIWIAAVVAASFHHIYSASGQFDSSGAARFALLTAASAGVCGLLVFFAARASRPS